MGGGSDDEQAERLPFATITAAGVRLAVRLTPRAARTGLDGVVPGADGRFVLQLRVAAPPVEGAANAALVDYVAKSLRLRRSEVAVVSGERGRLKLLNLSGDSADLLARLARWLADERRRP